GAPAQHGNIAAVGSSASKRRRRPGAVDSLVKLSADGIANASSSVPGVDIGESQVGRAVKAAALKSDVEVVGSTLRREQGSQAATRLAASQAKQVRAGATRVATTMASPRMRSTSQPLVVICNTTLYRDYRRVIKGLDWTIESGTHWAVLG